MCRYTGAQVGKAGIITGIYASVIDFRTDRELRKTIGVSGIENSSAVWCGVHYTMRVRTVFIRGLIKFRA